MDNATVAAVERALWMEWRPTDIASVGRASQRRLTDMAGNVWAHVYYERRAGCYRLSPLGDAKDLPGLELEAQTYDDAVAAMRAGKSMVLTALRRQASLCAV